MLRTWDWGSSGFRMCPLAAEPSSCAVLVPHIVVEPCPSSSTAPLFSKEAESGTQWMRGAAAASISCAVQVNGSLLQSRFAAASSDMAINAYSAL